MVERIYKKKYFNLVFSGKNQTAQTPPWLWDQIKESAWGTFAEVFDPCPPNPKIDGLKIPWGPRAIVNPPYNNIAAWLEKAWSEYRDRGVSSVFIIPFRPSRRYFHEYAQISSGLYVLSRRVKFVGYKRPFPGAICLLCFGCKLQMPSWRNHGWNDHTVDVLYKDFPGSAGYKDERMSCVTTHYGGSGQDKTVLGSPSEILEAPVVPNKLFMILPFVHTDYFQKNIEKVTSMVMITPVLVMEGYESRSLLGSVVIGMGDKQIKTKGVHKVTFLL